MPNRKTVTVPKDKILIVDDSELNREMLVEILGEKYDYAFAGDGVEAIELLGGGAQVDIMLLDVHMPKMDGFGVLNIMNERHWIEEIPVIIVSAEDDAVFIRRAYELGATDYMTRPFNASVVRHRVENTLALYSKQKRLVRLVEDQVYEREKDNNMMINIFSHVIESRNKESGSHTLHVQSITSLLLHRLVRQTDRYKLSEADISLISCVSALHDIGKLKVPESILNKPGKLTPEEWEVMKAHTTEGDKFLRDIPIPQTEKLMVVAHEICRWHHERWDGRGYPDGLRGDEIPISAQVVSLADVYDALTSDRCYKKAFPHEKAIEMILNGECGAFNPLLLTCLTDAESELRDHAGSQMDDEDYRDEVIHMTGEMLSDRLLPLDDRSRRMVENERVKKEFFAMECGGIQFEYDCTLDKVIFVNWYEEEGRNRKHLYVTRWDDIQLLNREDWQTLVKSLRATTRENPVVQMKVLIPVGTGYRWNLLTAMSVWPVRGDKYISVVGQFRDIHDEVLSAGMGITEVAGLSYETYRAMQKMFGVVRIVDPTTTEVLEVGEDGTFVGTGARCYELWGRHECCENCTSMKALQSKNWTSKLEVGDDGVYSVLSRYMKLNGRDCVLEIAFPMEETADGTLRRGENDKANLMLLNFYRDSLTKAYSRGYLDDFMANLQSSNGVAIADIDQFKNINDRYGHLIGDAALRAVSATIKNGLGKSDVLIRYGGDEFLLLFKKIGKEEFYAKLEQIEKSVQEIVLEEKPEIRLSISIGGAYEVHPLAKAMAVADSEMYKNKAKSRMKQ